MTAATPRWRPSAGIEATDLGDEMLVHDRARGRVLVLNGTARAIWVLCDGSRDDAAVAREIASRYGIGEEEARTDVGETISRLHDLGLVEG